MFELTATKSEPLKQIRLLAASVSTAPDLWVGSLNLNTDNAWVALLDADERCPS